MAAEHQIGKMLTLCIMLVIWALLIGLMMWYRKRAQDCVSNPAIRCWNDWMCWDQNVAESNNSVGPTAPPGGYTGNNVKSPNGFLGFYQGGTSMGPMLGNTGADCALTSASGQLQASFKTASTYQVNDSTVPCPDGSKAQQNGSLWYCPVATPTFCGTSGVNSITQRSVPRSKKINLK